MAQWEREEISSRVAASVPIRAELGKPLGGAAPFGYTWKGKELQINPTEAPIRKQMYDLFMLHRRLHVVANELNKLGHRTRNGSKFTHTTIERLLRDPMAKGFRRANYTKSRGEKKHWDLKPESEWVITPCPAIVTEEVWAQCNEVMEGRVSKRTKAPRKSVHLFSGTLMCGCGGKMYVPSRVSKYVCQDCKQTHISTEDIEEIYFEQLRGFLLSKDELPTFIARTEAAMEAAQIGFESANAEKVKVREQMDGIIKLHSLGQIPTDRFKEYYAPLDEQFRQLGNTVERHAAELDYLKVQMLNGDHILSNAEDLYDRWPKMSKEEKRQTVEELTRSIVIDGEDITITFSYAPPLLENTPTAERNLMDACSSWKAQARVKSASFGIKIDENSHLGLHIRKRRLELGITQIEVGKQIGVSENSIYSWETGRNYPQIHQLPKIMQFLGYNPYIKIDVKTFGGKIKLYRLLYGLSYRKMGKVLGADPSIVVNWKKGLTIPSKAELSELKIRLQSKRSVI